MRRWDAAGALVGRLRAILGPLPDEAAVIENLLLLNSRCGTPASPSRSRKTAFLATVRHESGFRADAVEPGDELYRRWASSGWPAATLTAAPPTTSRSTSSTDSQLASSAIVRPVVAVWRWTVACDVSYAADRLDMAAVDIAAGCWAGAVEDTGRCGDVQKALAWFSGGRLPDGNSCDRCRAVSVPVPVARPVRRAVSPADEVPDAPEEPPVMWRVRRRSLRGRSSRRSSCPPTRRPRSRRRPW